MTYAPRTFDPADDANTKLAGVTSVPITHYQKGTRHIPAIRLRTIFRHRGNFATALISAYYRQAPNWGRELFLPGGRPPVNVSCKGGRSPNSARIRDTLRRGTRIQRLVSGECQARCPLADVLCISVITQIYSWNWPNRRAHFRWTGNETAVARAVCDPVQRGLDEFHDAK